MTVRRRWLAGLLALVLAALGGLGVVSSQAVHLSGVPVLPVPWWLLLAVYLVADQVNPEFTRRDAAVAVSVVQLPLALGAVLVPPPVHLVVRLLSSSVDSGWHRRDLFKAGVNAAMATVELGIVTLVLSVGHPHRAGPLLWVLVLAALMAGDLVSHLCLNLLFTVLGMPRTRRDLVEPLLSTAVVTTVFAGLSVLMLAAAWTDTWTLLAVVVVATVLGLSYRTLQRLAVQQRSTDDLYAFVQGLGPVDAEQAESLTVLERVRELLQTRRLELQVRGAPGGPVRCLRVGLDTTPTVIERPPGSGRGLASGADVQPDRMAAPLIVDGELVGLLSAEHRLSSGRGFDLKDLRLLATVATELAGALERGRLLGDLARAALTDPTTGLPNLHSATQQLEALLRAPEPVLVAAVAVDSFREVNETLGHEVGNDLLREVASRLVAVAPDAVVGRIGGGRFAVAVTTSSAGVAPGEGPGWFGLSLRGAVEGPANVGPVGTHVRLSVGCALSPDHGDDASTLLRRAETAMYSARSHRGGPVIWQPAYEVQGQRRRAVVLALRDALDSGGLDVVFQPKICCATGRAAGVEALARWSHPALGAVAPAEFVPLAEATGLMGPLTAFVLQQSLQACRSWARNGAVPGAGPDGAGEVGVSVNVSADILQDSAFVHEVARQLEASGVPAHLLTLELTEDVVVADVALAARRMSELRALGVSLSIDDFGTGYSSLTYLKELPIDEVKIDKGFVAHLTADPADQAVVRAVVDIAHTIGLTVVAEGVETEEQHAVVRGMGVDQEQGTLHAAPMSGDDVSVWLRQVERQRRG